MSRGFAICFGIIGWPTGKEHGVRSDFEKRFFRCQYMLPRDEKELRSMTQNLRGAGKQVAPNDPCPCGSGKKYKKCHGSANPPI